MAKCHTRQCLVADCSVVEHRRQQYCLYDANKLPVLCYTEVIADDTKAIDAVVNADKKRLALIEERQRLEAEKGKPGEHHGERLKEVALLLMNMICLTIYAAEFSRNI